ncbi:MAG: UDP-N-acetylmuramoyl-tripeptide--D-alanyl-D-alanine ligase [Gammaproteobacteria bacterium]|nr:UDP-N-acetylmuramoyl-tripeptide--D-alanyl-D-alanine ligase [Gammaproteobacteria bacterium]
MQVLNEWTLQSAAQVLGCEAPANDAKFSGVSTDTRTIKPGDLFFAITGENFDGHEYVGKAAEQGAVAAVVSRETVVSIPQLKVDDTRIALGALAAAHRKKFKKPVIGLTGSNGKTTVKELLSAILARCGKVLATAGNFNNDIGLPHTLFRLQLDEDFAVLEMGANHPGEIAYLSAIASPDVAILNNAGAAHLEGFGSLQGVAKAKGEIFENLSSKAVAVINRDDDFADYWLGITRHCKRIGFGIENTTAEVRASDLLHSNEGVAFRLHIAQQSLEVNLALFGRHNVMNALAAAAAAHVLGVSIEDIRTALNSFQAVKGRLKAMTAENGCMVFDDTYNANPNSLYAGIDVLVALPGTHVLVMGDMLEVGKDTATVHFQAGEYAKQQGVDRLFAYGPQSVQAVKAFGDRAQHFATHDDLAKALKEILDADVKVLVKGSRGMQMEKIVNSLKSASEV